jgi:hypothetical protein
VLFHVVPFSAFTWTAMRGIRRHDDRECALGTHRDQAAAIPASVSVRLSSSRINHPSETAKAQHVLNSGIFQSPISVS